MEGGKQPELEQQIHTAIAKGSYHELVIACEDWEHKCAEFSGATKATQPYYSVQLLAYYITNDLNAARFLWRRIHKKVRDADPELVAVWGIGQQLYKKANYGDIYASFHAYNWSAPVVPLIQALSESFRQRTFNLIASAYSSISVTDARALLGLGSEADVVALSGRAGWTHEAATNTLVPAAASNSKVQKTGLDQLQQLTEYVVWLEQK
eukprot:TRINITY_DN15531_c0_g1_i1.p1 TRINITY_DN15531_c0_g1~~TRINITY_DN15531_c0_g1_i1.p1  ORF type:complete len:209 (+),score=31.89 TRINITY_DN15531_c0_g1_i1:36-662(+)